MTDGPDARAPGDGPPPRTDQAHTLLLIQRAQAGDGAALNALFARYGERLRVIVRLRLGPALRRRLDSGDIVQEALLAALQDFGRFEARDEASLLQWLSTLAANRIRDAADFHGAGKRDIGRESPLGPPGDTGPAGADAQAPGPTPAEQAAHLERLRAIEAAVCELPDAQRELIIQRHYVGREWNEVAEHSGHPSGPAARMAYAKVLVALARRLRGGDAR